MSPVGTMTIIRTSGFPPDVVVNGVVNAEIRKQREMYQRYNDALLRENDTLRRRRDDLKTALDAERGKPIRRAVWRKLIAVKDAALIVLLWPWLISGDVSEWFKRTVLGYDDYDLGRTSERK